MTWDMHPYVAEELAPPPLASQGYLEAIRVTGSSVEYRNIKVDLADPRIREDQLKVLIKDSANFPCSPRKG